MKNVPKEMYQRKMLCSESYNWLLTINNLNYWYLFSYSNNIIKILFYFTIKNSHNYLKYHQTSLLYNLLFDAYSF